VNIDGMDLIADIRQIYDNFGFDTQILAASIRTVNHVTQSALNWGRCDHSAAKCDQIFGQSPFD
jgi:transaldolase